jgi:hypothetical protein
MVVSVLFVLLLCFGGCVGEQEDDDVDMSFASHDLMLDRPLQLGMDILVVLVGMESIVEDVSVLQNLLRASMSVKAVHAAESGTNLLVQYVTNFDVIHREKLIWGHGNTLPTVSDIEECVFTGLLDALKKRNNKQQQQQQTKETLLLRNADSELVVNVTSTNLDKVLSSFVHQINNDIGTGKVFLVLFYFVLFVCFDPELKKISSQEREKRFHHTVFVLHPDLNRMASFAAEGPDRKLFDDAIIKRKLG